MAKKSTAKCWRKPRNQGEAVAAALFGSTLVPARALIPQELGDGLKLARAIVDQFGEAIETDAEINGGDAVDFIAEHLYPEALAIVQDADNKQEGR